MHAVHTGAHKISFIIHVAHKQTNM